MSAEADDIYTPTRGVVVAPHSVNVIADQVELAFYVDRDGNLVFLEHLPGTWSEYVAKRAKRGQTTT